MSQTRNNLCTYNLQEVISTPIFLFNKKKSLVVTIETVISLPTLLKETHQYTHLFCLSLLTPSTPPTHPVLESNPGSC